MQTDSIPVRHTSLCAHRPACSASDIGVGSGRWQLIPAT
jgi:hypothetical protein